MTERRSAARGKRFYFPEIFKYPDGGTSMREHPAGYSRSPVFTPYVSYETAFAGEGMSTTSEPESVAFKMYTGLSSAPVDTQISPA